MSIFCVVCGKPVNQIINGEPICDACENKRYVDGLRSKEDSISEAADFKGWRMDDMSELFWIHLGLYQKEPNRHSLDIMRCALNWAVHADRGLANSFRHALKWIGVDNIYAELSKFKD